MVAFENRSSFARRQKGETLKVGETPAFMMQEFQMKKEPHTKKSEHNKEHIFLDTQVSLAPTHVSW